jgi:hypothetical protein
MSISPNSSKYATATLIPSVPIVSRISAIPMGQSLSASCVAIAAAQQQGRASPLYSSNAPSTASYSRMMLSEISFATCNVYVPSRCDAEGNRRDQAPLDMLTSRRRYDGQSAHPVPISPGSPLSTIDDSKPWTEVPWSDRRGYLVNALTNSGPLDVIGFQVCPIGTYFERVMSRCRGSRSPDERVQGGGLYHGGGDGWQATVGPECRGISSVYVKG